MTRPVLLAALVLILLPAAVFGQATNPVWSARTRLQLTGTSDASDPDGYTVYSGVPIEVSLRRDVGRRVSVEVSASLESREVDTIRAGVSPRLNLGSIQTLPLNLLLQARPWSGGRFRPYAGAGVNVTTFWEKSGALDSMDLTPGIGLAVQLGTDIVLSDAAVFNVDVKWNELETDLESGGAKVAHLAINPLSLGVGFGFRF